MPCYLKLTCQHKKPLQQLEKQLSAAQSLLSSLQNRKPLKEIQLKSRAPANKNIQQQLRFYSTKKKRKHDRNVRYSKPTREEGELIFKRIQSGPKCSENDHNHNEMLHWFGIEEAKIKQYTTTRKKFSKGDMVLDEDHPPGEALASDSGNSAQCLEMRDL